MMTILVRSNSGYGLNDKGIFMNVPVAASISCGVEGDVDVSCKNNKIFINLAAQIARQVERRKRPHLELMAG
jgi:hypothetical protein